MGRTCGEPDEIKKNTHPKYITALFGESRYHLARTRYSSNLVDAPWMSFVLAAGASAKIIDLMASDMTRHK